MTRCWQSMQKRDTENLNVDEDLEDVQSTARKAGWSEEEKTARLCKAAGRRQSTRKSGWDLKKVPTAGSG